MMKIKTTATAKQLHNLRGYGIVILCSRGVKAKRLNLTDPSSDTIVSIKLLYAGAADNPATGLHPPKDPYTYTKLYSPFPEKPSPNLTYGFLQDDSDNLWATYFSYISLKDTSIYDNDFKIVFEVPEILAEKKPELTIKCNNDNDIVHKETLDHAGIYTRTISLQEADAELITYMQNVRQIQTKMLKELNRLCSKYELNYYLICGGLIGIIRDGDLIPWDDDLDIAMMRTDYEKLKEAVKEEWKDNNDFLWLNCDDYGEDVFLDFMTRIIYTKDTIESDAFSRLIDKGRQDILNHLPLDIYILDDAHNNKLLHCLHTKRIQLLYVLSLGHRPEFYADEHKEFRPMIRLAVKLLSSMGKKIPLNKLFRWYRNSTASTKKNAETVYQSNGYFNCLQLKFRKEWFGNGRTADVCGQKVSIPENSEAFLEQMYGDYRQYPPVSDRQPMHHKKMF